MRAGGGLPSAGRLTTVTPMPATPSTFANTRVIYGRDTLEQLRNDPPGVVDLIYIDPPFNSACTDELFWATAGERVFRRPARVK